MDDFPNLSTEPIIDVEKVLLELEDIGSASFEDKFGNLIGLMTHGGGYFLCALGLEHNFKVCEGFSIETVIETFNSEHHRNIRETMEECLEKKGIINIIGINGMAAEKSQVQRLQTRVFNAAHKHCVTM